MMNERRREKDFVFDKNKSSRVSIFDRALNPPRTPSPQKIRTDVSSAPAAYRMRFFCIQLCCTCSIHPVDWFHISIIISHKKREKNDDEPLVAAVDVATPSEKRRKTGRIADAQINNKKREENGVELFGKTSVNHTDYVTQRRRDGPAGTAAAADDDGDR